MRNDAVFFSVSGQRLTNRTILNERLRSELPKIFPAQRFEFLGSPFNRLPFPLMWNEDERAKPATTRLLECWGKLDMFCARKLRPLLSTDALVFTHGFGIDALLYATACIARESENDEAFRLHDGLVRLRLKEQNIPAPEYFITRANVRTLDSRIVEAMPALADVPQPTRFRFIRHEEHTVHEYFERIKNQKKPHFIDADETVGHMVEQVAGAVERRLRQRASA